MSFHAYMLRCSDGSYYVGHTDDLDVRMATHQSGLLPGYTRSRRPVQLVWQQDFPDRDQAFAAERQIKGWSRAKKEALIRGDWEAVQLLARKLFLRPSFDTPPLAATQDERSSHGAGPLALSSGLSEAGGGVSKDERGMIDLDEEALLDAMAEAAREAGAAILDIVAKGFDIEQKGDSSPVTAADHAAELIILGALARAAPGVPVIAEEEVAAGRIPAHGGTFFLVDPLDGTKEFVRGGDDYTVNIALVVDASPRLGVVFAPATGRLHGGIAGSHAWLDHGQGRTPIACRDCATPPVVVASRSHFTQNTSDYLALAAPGCGYEAIGSSLKFCIIAEGRADLYPRLAPTAEWDTAAGHAVLLGAGGTVVGPDGAPLRYGKPAFLNRAFIATGGWDAPRCDRFLADFAGGGELPEGV